MYCETFVVKQMTVKGGFVYSQATRLLKVQTLNISGPRISKVNVHNIGGGVCGQQV